MNTTDNQNEMFIVVNTDDQIIGYKTRFACHHDKSLIHRVIGVAVVNKNGEILLQKRSQTKDMDPGLWGISTAGHVEKGQSYEEAAKREMKEELGIEVPVTFVAKFIVHGTEETEMASFFTAVHNGPFIINPDETERVEFFAFEKIKNSVLSGDLILTEGAKENLRLLGILI